MGVVTPESQTQRQQHLVAERSLNLLFLTQERIGPVSGAVDVVYDYFGIRATITLSV